MDIYMKRPLSDRMFNSTLTKAFRACVFPAELYDKVKSIKDTYELTDDQLRNINYLLIDIEEDSLKSDSAGIYHI